MKNSRLKFRAWDKHTKTMWRWEDHNAFSTKKGSIKDWFTDSDLVQQQFTGKMDEEGKEIYEGDIVLDFRISRSFPAGRYTTRVIEWNDDMTLDDSFGEKAVGFNLFGGRIKVIGNIYETPELLEQKN